MTQKDFFLENELILECSQTRLNAEQVSRIKHLLDNSLQWNYLLETAHRNGVLALVSWNLLKNFGDTLPPEIKTRTALRFQEHTQNNLFLTAKLLEIIRLLSDAGISVLPFKGPLLAMQAYENLSLRQFVDLDVLVQPKHFDRAVRILSEHGYRTVGEVHWLKRKSLFFTGKKDVGLVNDDLSVRIELHWKLSGAHFALPFELNNLWERLENQNLGGARVQSLAFADLFIYLCLHGSRHGWERLAWICDLRELIRVEHESARKTDWQAIKRKAQSCGCEKVVELGLFLVWKFFGVKTDYPLFEEIERDETFQKITAQIRNKIFVENSKTTEISERYMYHLALKEKKFDKLKLHYHYFLWYLRLVLTPNSMDKAVFNLPRIFYPLYYILRPTRLLYGYFSQNKAKQKLLYLLMSLKTLIEQ